MPCICSSFPVNIKLVAVDSVNIATNYDAIKDGPCSGELVVVTCSVVGISLTWTVTDTSLSITGSNTITLIANEADVGTVSIIGTTTISLKFVQTETTQNMTHPSSSTIESLMQFRLESGFVVVSCTDYDLETDVITIITLGM